MTTQRKADGTPRKCHGCGIQKDSSVKELYPYPDEDGITDQPIGPFFNLDVEPERDGQRSLGWKDATVCHQCFHKLEPDMWIHERCWKSIGPVVGFKDLPDLSARADSDGTMDHA